MAVRELFVRLVTIDEHQLGLGLSGFEMNTGAGFYSRPSNRGALGAVSGKLVALTESPHQWKSQRRIPKCPKAAYQNAVAAHGFGSMQDSPHPMACSLVGSPSRVAGIKLD